MGIFSTISPFGLLAKSIGKITLLSWSKKFCRIRFEMKGDWGRSSRSSNDGWTTNGPEAVKPQPKHKIGTTKGTKSTKNQHLIVHRTHRINRNASPPGRQQPEGCTDWTKCWSWMIQTAPAARRLSSLRIGVNDIVRQIEAMEKNFTKIEGS